MTKVQKIWLTIFLAMFVVPEVLWSPIGNFYYEFVKGMTASNVSPIRNNFLEGPDYLRTLKFIILLQTSGLALSLFILAKLQKGFGKWVWLIIVTILFILALFVTLYANNLL